SADSKHLAEELRSALLADALVLHYQPVLDLRTGRVCGVEALVRWRHPERGLLQPADFLGPAEAAGLMAPLTRAVLARAIGQTARWRAGGQELTVAVNLSAGSLLDRELPTLVVELLAAHDLPPAFLTVEVAEEVLRPELAHVREILAGLRSAGVTIAVDSFGSGFTSFAYLHDLPVDEVKLDRRFVGAAGDDALAGAVVTSATDLAHALGLRLVAVGVEDAAAIDDLARRGCDLAQGFAMSAPLPADELESWLHEHAAPGLRRPAVDRPNAG
ncbi:EAL domain-containing protein, partial [Actinotalea sp.]|uniref:EAL domain-containing protein n=1 Tax=Actinotalea sp. TaxID=1872145 RepID=UPI00356355AA